MPCGRSTVRPPTSRSLRPRWVRNRWRLPGGSCASTGTSHRPLPCSALPPVFVHGDCHTDNIVHATGPPVFCDWQSTGVGRAVSDLAFLSVRATSSGVVVPSALIHAYVDRRPGDHKLLECALVAEELAVLVFLWPPYAAFNSPTGIARVQSRARELAELYLGEAAHERG
ncbi:phosphotransferase [Planotetraspora silvatica]